MPLASAEHSHAVVSAWLEGLLPDDNAVRNQWGRRFQVDSSSAFSLLSTPIGEECAGAFAFLPEDRLLAYLNGTGNVSWLSEDQLADRLTELRVDRTSWLGRDFTGHFSLAGAQAKTALLFDPATGAWGVPSGVAATSHILKPAIAGLDDHDLNEHLCLSAAARTGLLVAPTRILRVRDISVVVSTRYDRAQLDQPWLTRIHQEDLCQALAVPPTRKYENEGGPGVRRVATLLRNALPVEHVTAGIWRFFDAVALNWLIGGTDAHAKNYSLLLAGNQVRFAPLYDVASALPYPDRDVHRLRLAMKFGGDYTLTPRTPSVWDKVASDMSLPVDAVRDRVGHLAARLPAALSDVAAEAEVRELGSAMPGLLVDKVAARVARCTATLTTTER
jgi:serine/threonine-protein kinase HipA